MPILSNFTMNIELHGGFPNSQKGPQNHNENGDPGSPFSWDPQNFMREKFMTLFSLSVIFILLLIHAIQKVSVYYRDV